MDPRGLRVAKSAHLSLWTHTKQLLFVTFCDTSEGIEVKFRTDREELTERDTDVEVEIVAN